MLTFLDALCAALAARDLPRLRSLLDTPLARLLPHDAQAEIRRFVAGRAAAHAVPMATLRFRDLTARLLAEAPVVPVQTPTAMPSAPASTQKRRRNAVQTELPLSA